MPFLTDEETELYYPETIGYDGTPHLSDIPARRRIQPPFELAQLGGGGNRAARTTARVPDAASQDRQALERQKYEDYQREVGAALQLLQLRVKNIRPQQGETVENLREQIVGPVTDAWRLVPGFTDEGASARITQAGKREEAAVEAARNVQVQAEAKRLMKEEKMSAANAYSLALLRFKPDSATVNANRLAQPTPEFDPSKVTIGKLTGGYESISGPGLTPSVRRAASGGDEMVSVPIPLEIQPSGVRLGRQAPQTATARLPMSNPLVQKYLGTNLQTGAVAGQAAPSEAAANEVIRVTKDGKRAIFDSKTKKFIRYAD